MSATASSMLPNRANYFNIPEISLCLYFLRDAMGGFFRYYSSVFGVEFLWFLPDLAAILCLGVFVHKAVMRDGSSIAVAVLLGIFFYLAMGYMFLGTIAALGSSFKMILPVFVGFCFFDKQISESRLLLAILQALMYVSIGGIIASKYIDMPWVGFEFEAFGATRSAGTLWWSQNELRLAGFAADNTMAGFFTMMTFVLSSFRRNLKWCIIVGSLALYAIDLTTSKTSLGIQIIYMACLVGVRMLPRVKQYPALRAFSLASFIAPFVPVALMIVFSGADLARSNPILFSMQDRIDNSWQLPFEYMLELFPLGVVTGCGVGCFNYPQNLFSDLARYWVPVDNFYIGTYLMFGLPFVAFVIHVIMKMRLQTDPYKHAIAFIMNIFTITVLSYGPASGLLMMATAFSCAFGHASQRRAATDTSTGPTRGANSAFDPRLAGADMAASPLAASAKAF